ncbi:MAG TPA: hypothetical protein VGX23_32565 [Actinocrinis sp.]|nr:hypothetical protein [Actinocrinis sp.]
MIRTIPGAGDPRPSPFAGGRTLRVSFSALLRVRDRGQIVLLRTPARPETFSPPGGVFKYFEPAAPELERLGFHEERTGPRGEAARFDLRGFVPYRARGRFRRWFAAGAFREDAAQCLRRELAEELAEVGFGRLAGRLRGLALRPVGCTEEGPDPVPGKPYLQLRHFEILELAPAPGHGVALHRELLDLARDPAVDSVIGATADQVLHGRTAEGIVAPQSALLFFSRRVHADVPTLPWPELR